MGAVLLLYAIGEGGTRLLVGRYGVARVDDEARAEAIAAMREERPDLAEVEIEIEAHNV